MNTIRKLHITSRCCVAFRYVFIGLLIGFLASGCYKAPKLNEEAAGIRIYRGKAALQECAYIGEISGIINTKGSGIGLSEAINNAEIDLKNKAIKYGADSLLVVHTESKYISQDYPFKIGVGGDIQQGRIDEYIMYSEMYRCNKQTNKSAK